MKKKMVRYSSLEPKSIKTLLVITIIIILYAIQYASYSPNSVLIVQNSDLHYYSKCLQIQLQSIS